MAVKVTPTRANLIKSKSQMAFSTKGYNLLDKKRTVLIQEIMKLVKEAKDIEDKITVTFAEAYQALQEINISIGLNNVQDYALSIPQEEDFSVCKRSVMGVDIPEVVVDENPNKNFSQPYGFSNNSPALDVAIEKFNEVKHLGYKLAEVENTAFKLSQEIKKASKSANALSKIKIPQLQETIRYIEDSIEEKEREETFRIKKVKKHNQARAAAEKEAMILEEETPSGDDVVFEETKDSVAEAVVDPKTDSAEFAEITEV